MRVPSGAVEEVVADAGPLLEGFGAPEGTRCLVPPRVLDELRKHGVSEYEMETRRLVPAQARQAALDRVREAARETGDAGVLSPADLDVLALALEHGATLVTDDYAVQNVASVLGVETRTFGQSGIRRTIVWEWVCTACRSHRGADPGECPVCGTRLKRRPRRA